MRRTTLLAALLTTLCSVSLLAQKQVTWTTHSDITITNDTHILKNVDSTANVWESGAASLESLGFSEDGYVEATITETNTFRMFGFSTDDIDGTLADIEYGFHLSGLGRIYINENGPQKYDPGIVYATGDKIRLERKDGVIKYYYINASGMQELYTSAIKTNDRLMVDFSFRTPGATLDNVQVSDNFYNPSTESHPNEGTSTHPDWTTPEGLDFRGNSIVKTLTTSAPNEAGASSLKVLNPSTPGWVEARISQTTTARTIGFSESRTMDRLSDITYGINISSTGQLGILEDGLQLHSTGIQYQLGDVVRIERSATGDITFMLKRDVDGTIESTDLYPDVIEHSITELHVSISLFTAGAALNDIVFSSDFIDPDMQVASAQSVLWTDVDNVLFTDNTVYKTAETQWGNSGSSSIAYISPGVDGWIEATLTETHTRRAFGLSESNINSDVQTIDFGIQFIPGGTLSVMESGVPRYSSSGNFTFATGDVFKIERLGTEIKYFKNSETTPFYISLVSSYSRLEADLAFHDNGASLSNLQFSESFESDQPAGGQWGLNPDATIFYGNAVSIGREAAIGDYLLSVQGEIRTQGILVTQNDWADYVFKKGYDLKSLAYVKQYIDEHGHLPDVPSEKEVTENGVKLEKINVILLKKIEELTLYMIEQNASQQQQLKQIEALQKELKALKKEK